LLRMKFEQNIARIAETVLFDLEFLRAQHPGNINSLES
jgi:hypothetical protein